MRLFRSVHPVDHYPFTPQTSTDTHGNPTGTTADTPTPRKAIAIYPTGSTEPTTIERAALTVTHLTMLVEDPTIYGHRDEVDIDGTRYEVNGTPADWRTGPFPAANRLFGGEVHLTRIG